MKNCINFWEQIFLGTNKMKIESHLSTKTRKTIRKKLHSHKTSYSLAIPLHRKYCSLTGFLHILPDFLILGVEKGGTSSLYDYLIQHPSISSASTKEINFFNKYYDRGLDWYRVCFPFKIHKSIKKNLFHKKFLTGEASVRYFDYPHAPERIKKISPLMKFIILLRNPVDRAYSQHSMVTRGGNENLSFEEAIDCEKERTQKDYEKMKNNKNFYSDNYFRHAYLDRGIYVDRLKNWMKIFPKEQFLIFDSKDFFENPSTIYSKTLFLNLPKTELKKYEVKGRKNENPRMDPNLRAKLIDFYRPHNKRLYEFLGVNYHWDD